MTRRSKILTGIAVSIAGLVLLLIVAAIITSRTQWFQNYVREKIIALTEESTGGKVELKSFAFDWHGLTVRMTDFVIHGTEPPGSAPLFQTPSIVLRLKLLSGMKKAVDLEYLGVDRPSANVIVFPNGQTNIPEPKIKKKSNETGLETVVDLAIHKIEINDGAVQFQQQSIPLSARGRDLKVGLMFDPVATRYTGELSMSALDVASGTRQPLTARVIIPVQLERDRVQVSNARIETPESKLVVNGALQNLRSPEISGTLTAHVALAELERNIDLPIHVQPQRGPQTIDAIVAVQSDRNAVQIQNASVNLGQTRLEASGNLKSGADFRGNLSLDEIGQLLRLAEQPSGTVRVAGKANLNDAGYLVTGRVDARNVSFREGDSRFTGIGVSSAVQADPKTITLNGFKLFAFGGELTADARVEELATFAVKGNLKGFDIQNLTAALLAKRVGYSGTISGAIDAHGNLKAPGAGGLAAEAHLAITPGARGVPVSGQINAAYAGNTNIVKLGNSQLRLPNSRLDLAGEPGRQAHVTLVSRNLNDFLPTLQIGSPDTKEMPVTLRGGSANVAADLTGPLAAPRISGHLAMTSFAVSQRPFDQFAADFTASQSGATVQNGSLTRNGSQAQFSASVGLEQWSAKPRDPLSVNATMRNADLADILAIAGQSDIRASGLLNADVKIAGTIGNPQGAAQLNVVNGAAYDEHFDRLQANVDLSDQLVNLRSAELAAGDARIDLRGTFRHPRDSFSTGQVQLHLASTQIQLAQFQTLQKERPGLAGIVSANADVAGDLRQAGTETKFMLSAVNADVKATGVRDRGQNYGDLTATARTTGTEVNARVDSDFAGSNIQIASRTRLAEGYPTSADANIRGLQIEKALDIAKLRAEIPATGTLSARAHASGTLDDPRANVTFDLTRAKVYDEPLDRLAGTVDYTNQLVNISSLEVLSPAGRIDMKGSLAHAPSDFGTGKVELHATSSAIDLRRLQTVQKSKPGLAGTLKLAADVSADLRKENGEQQILPSRADINGGVTRIEYNRQSFGDVTFQGETKGNDLAFKLDSNFAKSAIHGDGQVGLRGDYPMNAKLTFANVTYANLASFLGSQPDVRPAFDALVEGQATVSGAAKQVDSLKGELRLARVELSTAVPTDSEKNTKHLTLQNQGPIVARLDQSIIRIETARLAGKSTNIEIGGTASLDKTKPLDLTTKATVDLALLKEISQNFFSEGAVVLDSTVRGTMSQPLVNGRIELKNASVQMVDLPNGISNANGVILLNGTNATIRNLTAESGGGKVNVTGFAGLTGTTLAYNLKVNGSHVRTRYAGASVTANLTMTFSGTSDRSVLGGNVTIERVAYDSQSDIGSMLSGASVPAEAPSAGPGLVSGMRMNIRVQTAPDVRFQTSLAEELSATADLRVLGSPLSPGMVGRIDIVSGTLIFFGNKYNVNRGAIAFYNAQKIEPILDIDLETTAKGVQVSLSVSGPIENMKLSYRSDPPLKFDDIVALLATGRTPPDPTIAARQPVTPDQSVTQMGESAILTQAVANPLANRLERVFGVSQLKIDPTFNTGSGYPTAKVTIQQQVTPTIIFTYSQDLTQTNSQILRIEMALTPRFSAVATRDDNGIFGVDFFYKKQFR